MFIFLSGFYPNAAKITPTQPKPVRHLIRMSLRSTLITSLRTSLLRHGSEEKQNAQCEAKKALQSGQTRPQRKAP